DHLAVWVDDGSDVRLRGEHRDAGSGLALVADEVRSGRAGWEEDDVPWFELLLAAWMPDARCAGPHKEPVLLWPLVVVGTDRLAGRQLVGAQPGAGGPESRPNAAAVSSETL